MTKAQRVEIIVGKLSAPGEFIHIDGRTPRLASGQAVPRGVLKALEAAGTVSVINRDLFRDRPIQYGRSIVDEALPPVGALKRLFVEITTAMCDPAGRAIERMIERAVNPPIVVDAVMVPAGSMPESAVVPQFRMDGAKGWTEGNRLAARACWLSGQTKAEVARRFNTSRGFIVRMARVDNWPASR